MLPPEMPEQRMCIKYEHCVEAKINPRTCSTLAPLPYTSFDRSEYVNYRQVSNIRRTLTGNKFVDHSDVVGASPVGAAPTISSFST